MVTDPANEILPGLWLGNYHASQDVNWLKQNNITSVFNCTKNIPFAPGIPKMYRIPVDDNLQAEEIRNMTLWSNEIVYKLLKEHNQGHPILVHCAAGMQRSAASVAFFLIAYLKMRALDAMKFIKEKRMVAFYPRANFGRSIDYFDRRYHGEILPHVQKLPNSFENRMKSE
jgi:rhodanese-related sulfurtransferase